MTEFETIELIAMIVMFAPSIIIFLFFKKRKDLLRLTLGASFVSFSFVFSNLEALFLSEIFNLLEHLCQFFACHWIFNVTKRIYPY